MASISPAELRAALDRDGFVRIPHAFTLSEVEHFRAACQRTVAAARNGQWKYLRTLPKQFPPWNVEDVSETGIFKADLVMELYNMLVTPHYDWSLRWHRDDIGPDVNPEEELERLQEPMLHAQWNLALYEDQSLIVVPGSHKRARTPMERAADPYEDDMPGQLAVKVYPGDIVFYNNNILHRGVYDSSIERMTLHGTMGMKGSDPARARNILQHGIGKWAAQCDFHALPADTAKLAEDMKQRLLQMGSGDDVGYSQQDP
ncbi:hypothetical protein AC578_3449 [Pseudocercospora eumusae]|uniref:Phytanoyl-CoA dioxygenase n=1 Tax=Pseudocercospora eumusae TaxID=321146 RepID=A0A139HR02_9PEZI|nr:hypothetical protein AC578_3449 [Pseudocercospora eumusae]